MGSTAVVLCLFDELEVIYHLKESIAGTIPEEIGNSIGLQYIQLNQNYLIGELPSSMKRLVQLKSMDLSKNYLVGHMLDDFVYLPVGSLSLEGNKFWWYEKHIM